MLFFFVYKVVKYFPNFYYIILICFVALCVIYTDVNQTRTSFVRL